uniref:F-box domain-containing protein n=1 Tax=Trichuris muris TaxID=70415 RepID=A0A5S6R0C7_TRIMR
MMHLRSVARLMCSCSSVKICANNFKIRHLLMYPYGNEVCLNAVQQSLPNLTGLVLEATDEASLSDVVVLNFLPTFPNLKVLVLRNIVMGHTVHIPETVREIEWSNRHGSPSDWFFQELLSCSNLEALTIGGCQLNGESFERLVDSIKTMRWLRSVFFEFVTFMPVTLFKPVVPLFLDRLCFSSCLGNLVDVLRYFVQCGEGHLGSVAMQIGEDRRKVDPILEMSPTLRKQKIRLHMCFFGFDFVLSDVEPVVGVEVPSSFADIITDLVFHMTVDDSIFDIVKRRTYACLETFRIIVSCFVHSRVVFLCIYSSSWQYCKSLPPFCLITDIAIDAFEQLFCFMQVCVGQY